MMYVLILLFSVAFTIGAQGYPLDSDLPKCSTDQEQAVHQCGGDALLGWMSSRLGLSPALVNTAYLDNSYHGYLDNVDGLCLQYTKYEACINNFGMRLKCTSRLDMMVQLPYSYICGAGLKDARECLRCIVNANLDGSIAKQTTMGPCREAEMSTLSGLHKFFGAMNDDPKDILQQVISNVWCKYKMMSKECYEPAYMRVCGVAAKSFVHGMSGIFDKYMRDPDGGPVHCTTTELEPSKLPPGNTSSIFKEALVALQKQEKEIRGIFGICSMMDIALEGTVCLVESFSYVTGGEAFLPKDPMKLLESLCKSHSLNKFQQCISSKKSCPRNFLSDLGNILDSSCDMFSAVQKEKERGCYFPASISSLDMKAICGYDWSEIYYIEQSLGHTADIKRGLNEMDLLIKPVTCIMEENHKYLMQHLPEACSSNVRTKLDNLWNVSKHFPDDMRDMIRKLQQLLAQFSALSGRNNIL